MLGAKSWVHIDLRNVVEIVRLLLGICNDDFYIKFCGEKKGFYLWQQNFDPCYYQKPVMERMQIAFKLASNNSSGVLRTAITCGSLPKEAIGFMTDQEQTLKHSVAHEIGYREKYSRLFGHFAESSDILGDLIAGGADLQATSLDPKSPLLAMFSGFFYGYLGDGQLRALLFSRWIRELDHCGVDLNQYGRNETELHKKGFVSWQIRGRWTTTQKVKILVTWVLKEFSYGQVPSDWVFWIEARPFDNSVGYSEQIIPGAWEDDKAKIFEHSGYEKQDDGKNKFSNAHLPDIRSKLKAFNLDIGKFQSICGKYNPEDRRSHHPRKRFIALAVIDEESTKAPSQTVRGVWDLPLCRGDLTEYIRLIFCHKEQNKPHDH